MYLTEARYGGVGPFQEATGLESLHLNGCNSCSSTVEVKLLRLALTSKRTGDLYEFCCKDADDDGNTVIVAVVDGRVGDVLDIVPIDDSVTKLTARCEGGQAVRPPRAQARVSPYNTN
ncbi:hypothetical protein Bca101_033942 [Brassica carinata]